VSANRDGRKPSRAAAPRLTPIPRRARWRAPHRRAWPRVTIVALANHTGAAEDISGQLSVVSCQCLGARIASGAGRRRSPSASSFRPSRGWAGSWRSARPAGGSRARRCSAIRPTAMTASSASACTKRRSNTCCRSRPRRRRSRPAPGSRSRQQTRRGQAAERPQGRPRAHSDQDARCGLARYGVADGHLP
jgi:hypothetical protein